MALAVGAFAQANFTIVRPVDRTQGSARRSRSSSPRGAWPKGAYVGFFLNGQLIDATVPQIKRQVPGRTSWTPRGAALPDTPSGKPDRLEAKLYVNYNDQPRIVKHLLAST